MNTEPVISDEIDIDAGVAVLMHHGGGPGAKLAAAREAAKLTTSDVASHLNLTVNVIEALEQDDASRLPSAVFVRGYIKSYAQMVGISAADLLQMHDDQRPAEEAYEIRQHADLPPVGRRGPTARTLGIVIALIVALIAISWWLGGREYAGGDSGSLFGSLFSDKSPVAEAPAPAPAAALQTAPIVVQPAAEVVEVVAETPGEAVNPAEPVAASDGTDTLPAMEATIEAVAETAEEIPDEVVVPVVQAAVAETAAPPADSSEGVVRLRLQADSWVEIVDRDGQRLVFDLVRGGTDREVRGQMPLRVLLGRAAGVSMDVNGQSLDLEEYRAKGIARFVIDLENGQPVTRLP